MSGLMSIGKSAMFASYAALQTTSNNIANANTPGYSRQQAQLADAATQFGAAGFFGKGVDVITVTRAYDKYLTNQAVGSSSIAAADSARLDKLTQLEGLFPIGNSGVGFAAGEFLNSFVDLSNHPGDASARQVVSQAQDLTSRFRATGDRLGALQSGVSQDVKAQVDSVNALAKQIAALNQQIAALKGDGHPPNQLLDTRDHLIGQIAATLNITTIDAADGSVGVFVGGGQSLVLGAQATTLKALPDAFDPSKVTLALSEGATNRPIPADSLAGGSLAGLLKFQNEDLTSARNLLGQLAAAISGGVNRQQSLGLDLGTPASAGAPIFSIGTPRVLPARTNTGSAVLGITVDDATKLQASDYALAFDGSQYTLTRLSDQTTAAGSPYTPAQLAAGVQLDGITLRLTAGTPAVNDRFLLQPVGDAAQDMQTVLANTQGLAAAAPFTGSLGTNNTGSASIASLNAVDPAYDGTLSAGITFTNGTGAYAWSLSNGATGTGQWTAGTPISLNGFELNLAGVPKTGDTLKVQPTVSVATNNGNALAFARLGTVGLVAAPGSANAGSQTVTDAYASAIADIGVRVQGGKTAASISGAVASQAETARSGQAGVNLDEEAARLIQFQQSYQAAAKILQVAQQIFDTVLRTAAG